ncbi:MAG: hypothetical protein R3A48_13330 [Polyangiales bacterium]
MSRSVKSSGSAGAASSHCCEARATTPSPSTFAAQTSQPSTCVDTSARCAASSSSSCQDWRVRSSG